MTTLTHNTLQTLLNNHNTRCSITQRGTSPNRAARTKFRWINSETGELQTSLFWATITSIVDWRNYRVNTFKWGPLEA